MIAFDITPNIEQTPWTDCAHVGELALMERIGLLPRGAFSGQPVVMIKILLPDGSTTVAQTTWKLFRAACGALHAAVEHHGMMVGVEDS